MKYPKSRLAQTVIESCEQVGVKHIVISPGSRNAPLTLGFTNQAYFKCYSIVDERCAAFFALGISQQLNETVALVCTSGSALLNYFPAIAEAFYSEIPLVVLSADRPKHLLDIGDGQTINQQNVYGKHVLKSVQLLENDFDDSLEITTQNYDAIYSALQSARLHKGPVHINCPFNEPLYDLVDSLMVKKEAVKTLNDITKPYDLEKLKVKWNSFNKVIVLVGVLQPNMLNSEVLMALAMNPKLVVLKETSSNLENNSNFISTIDRVIAPLSDTELESLQPDLVVTIGGFIVSKKIKQFLRTYSPKAHWHIGLNRAYNTFFKLEVHIKTEPNEVLKPILSDNKEATTSGIYKLNWLSLNETHFKEHLRYLKTAPYSDLSCFHTILEALPENCNLQVSNSSAIRYTQLFGVKPSVKVFCNRGTSGIDGSTSTAIGCAVASKNQTILLTGDLSFFYDSNALWNAYIPENFRIVLINNSGGGIFRILPADKSTPDFDTFFETTHNLTAKQLCNMYGFEYGVVSSKDELQSNLSPFFNSGNRPKLLEIKTPSTVNDTVLKAYFKALKADK